MKFLFWNVRGAVPEKELTALVSSEGVDVLVLAEDRAPSHTEAILTRDVRTFVHVTYEHSKVHVFTSYVGGLTNIMEDGAYHCALQTHPPLLPPLLLIGVHFPSKLHQRPDSQTLETAVLADSIRALEKKVGHSNTVLLGDLNMDPFEPGVVGAKGLHAVSSAAIAQRGRRMVSGRAYEFFYNPTWAHMTDRTSGPPGTYFRRSSEHVSHFWHSLDQVLLRPALLGWFKPDGLRVLTSAGSHKLVADNGRPAVSDHLPLVLTLEG